MMLYLMSQWLRDLGLHWKHDITMVHAGSADVLPWKAPPLLRQMGEEVPVQLLEAMPVLSMHVGSDADNVMRRRPRAGHDSCWASKAAILDRSPFCVRRAQEYGARVQCVVSRGPALLRITTEAVKEVHS